MSEEPRVVDRFQSLLGSTPEDVRSGYLELRRKLVRYFQRRGQNPELLAEEIIARAGNLVHHGAEVNSNIGAFCYDLAQLILREGSKQTQSRPGEETAETAGIPGPGLYGQQNTALNRELLEPSWPPRAVGPGWVTRVDSDVFREYHEGDRRTLCHRLGITESALRLKIVRMNARVQTDSSPAAAHRPGGSDQTLTRYMQLPTVLEGKVSLPDFIEFERDWPATNCERGQLIDKSLTRIISEGEQARLDRLQAYTDYRVRKSMPLPTELLDKLESLLGMETPGSPPP